MAQSNGESVLIMMATYNSEQFIEEQLDSIINQSFKNWHLIVQDDMSSDATQDIVKRYARKDSRISFKVNDSAFHGPYLNFHLLLKQAKNMDSFNYYMFSDHDDIWDAVKIENMIDVLRKQNDVLDKPILLYGNMRVIDDRSQLVLGSLDEKIGIHFVNNISTFFAHNVYGCNTMFNYELLMKIPNFDISDSNVRILSHDNLVAKIAAIYGKVLFLKVPLMSYRRYGNNVTSKQSYSYGLLRIIKRASGFKTLARDHALTYKQSIYLIKTLNTEVPRDKRGELKKIVRILEQGGISAALYVIKNKVSWGKKVKSISRMLVLISGQYKKYL